jgi:glycosyltransferase involved in cell wall biosynthesis
MHDEVAEPVMAVLEQDASAYPRVLVVTDYGMSVCHGTGACLLRHFGNWPPDRLLNVYWGETPGVADVAAHRVVSEPMPTIDWGLHPRRMLRQILARHRAARRNRQAQTELARLVARFRPEAIRGIVYGTAGFSLLRRVLQCAPGIRASVEFWDLRLAPDERHAERLLRRIRGRCDDAACISADMNTFLEPVFGRHLPERNIFCCDVDGIVKREHRECTDGLRLCMVGNVWLKEMLDVVTSLWRHARETVGSLEPVAWYAHVQSLKRLGLDPAALPTGLRYAGCYEGEALKRELVAADACLIPFNQTEGPENDYAEYSIPSRVTELCSVGLPSFWVAGRDTPAGRYVLGHGIGVARSWLGNEANCRQAFVDFLRDRGQRETIGRSCRELAEREYATEQFQEALRERLQNICAER